MDTKKLAGVVAATAFMFSIGTAPPASATSVQVVGIEQRLQDPNGTEIGYTVTKILPSADPVAYPVVGQLYEATVEAKAIRGTVVPVVPFFNARAESSANYRVLAEVSTLSGAPIPQTGVADGKIYFDAVGDAPNSVVYNNGIEDLLVWIPAGQPMPGGSTDGGGSDSTGGDQGVTGSTGPNDVSPETSGGEAGNTGEGGVEGGGGNLETGGGSGATDADTGS